MPSALPDALILCGGAGLRLRSITGDTPKSMASVSGRPFLEMLLQQLAGHNFGRVIMAVGYGAQAIEANFSDHLYGMRLVYSHETAPLGTAGALRNAAELFCSESVVVLNGDSYTDVNVAEFVENHKKSRAEASVVVVGADERIDCGFVQVDDSGHVVRFDEKEPGFGRRFINAGLYAFSSALLKQIPEGQVSLEKEMLPRWLSEGKVIKAFVHHGTCIDIGTPERYRNAQTLLARVESGSSSAGA
jgi:D-glycero-alpha-D-manno-heptose 1-phosphate guanylyltransferase